MLISVEEAEILCDRIGIFTSGKLQCIGSPKVAHYCKSIYIPPIHDPKYPSVIIYLNRRNLLVSGHFFISLSFIMPLLRISLPASAQAYYCI